MDRVARQRWWFFANQLLLLGGTQPAQVIGALASEKFVQNDANGVEVAPGIGWLAQELFWRGISGGVGGRRNGGMDGASVSFWIKIFGHAEVNHDGASIPIDQNVAWFEVTVDDAVVVDFLDRIQNGLCDSKSIHKSKPVGIAPLVQRFSIDVFHDEERAAVFRGPTIDAPRDVGVRQRHQNSIFPLESVEHLGRVVPLVQDLQGHPFLQPARIADGQIHRAKSTAAKFLDHPVAADVARQFGLVHIRQKVSKQRRLALEEAIEVIARV